MNWISQWDDLTLCLPFPVLQDLIVAINERCVGAGISIIPAMTEADYLLHTNSTILNTIQSKVTALITLYVNHTDNSGNWDGQATIPNWTEATILAEIGDPARLLPDTLYVSKPWLEQQYAIVNLLRSKKIIIDYVAGGVGTDKGQFGTGLTYAQAQSDFISSGVVASQTGLVGIIAVYPGQYRIVMEDRKAKYTTNSSFQSLDTLYFLTSDSFDPFLVVGDFQHNGAYNKIFTYGEQGLSQLITTDWILTQYPYAPPWPEAPIPEAPPAGQPTGMQLKSGTHFAVQSFTGPNGFTHKDW